MSQLWLNVFEGGGTEWPPTVASSGWRVELTHLETLQTSSLSLPFRSSPLFPATGEFLLPELDGAMVYFYFCCFDPAFPVIARLIEKSPLQIRTGLLFSLGLASVVVVSKEKDLLETISVVTGESPRSSEVWCVEDSIITNVLINAPLDDDAGSYEIPVIEPYESLPLVQKAMVDEFVSSIGLLLPKVAIHLPTELNIFTRLTEKVNELILEMKYATNPVEPIPETMMEFASVDMAESNGIVSQILYQATDRLIQVNSALSLLSTQALSGAIPIMERRSLIRRYSVLGVGTAILAITRIARSIENAFAQANLETIVGERAIDAPPLPGLEGLPEYDHNNWHNYSVNKWKGKVGSRDLYPKLPYFSNLLGFRESEYTISAALHSLAAGSGPEWSLLTLTHEMVHGHVRNILALLFQGDPAMEPSQKWMNIYERFSAKVLREDVERESLLDSLRCIILFYCCMSHTHGSLTHFGDPKPIKDSHEVGFEFYLPTNPGDVLNLLEREFRNINEILVHVLDFHYFYLGNLGAYVSLIWRSWSILPQVKGDLRQYLLRTLLVASTNTSGCTYDRFTQSKARVIDVLKMLAKGPCAAISVIAEAVEYLENVKKSEILWYPFAASIVLVDMAHRVLTSNEIRGLLNGGDPHLDIMKDELSGDEWFEYSLPDGFVDDVVKTPTAYLADRLAKALSKNETETLEQDTVLMFLACCSSNHNGHQDE